MGQHVVQQGEHLSSIAELYGFEKYETIWNHPQNTALKAERDNPNVLLPGDVVEVPDKDQKSITVATTEVHILKVETDKLELRIVIRDYLDQPISNSDCTLEVDGKVERRRTGLDGLVKMPIPRTAKAGNLSIRGESVEIRIGHLDPVSEPSGQIARLNNLGYLAGLIEEPDQELLKSAVEEFQCDHKLKVDGDCGTATQVKLKEVHGC